MGLGRSYRRLWAGNAAANLADGISFVAIPLLATALTTDPLVIAGLTLVYSVTRLLVVLHVGVLVDRMPRGTILWTTNLVRGLLLVLLAVLMALGVASILMLYVVLALIGILESAADNAALAVLPNLVADDDLDRANSQIAGTQLVADEFAGPPLGGLLFAAAIALPILTTGALYVAAALFFVAMQVPHAPPAATPTATVGADLRAGVLWLSGHRPLRGLALIGGLASVAYMMPFSILVVYALETLQLEPTGYGLLLAASAMGGLLGAVIVVPLRRRFGYGRTVAGSLLLGSVTLIGLSLTTNPWVAGVLLAAYILHSVVWGVCVTSLRQRLVPDALRGRVNAAVKLIGLLGLSVGALAGGAMAVVFGLGAPFLLGGVIFGGCAMAAWLVLSAGAPGPLPQEHPLHSLTHFDHSEHRDR